MVPGHRRKFEEIALKLTRSAEQNDTADNALYVIFDTIAKLTQMATDFHSRPEVNSQ